MNSTGTAAEDSATIRKDSVAIRADISTSLVEDVEEDWESLQSMEEGVTPKTEKDETDGIVDTNTRIILCLKRTVLAVLVIAGMIVAGVAYYALDEQERDQFRAEYRHDANELARAFYAKTASKLWTGLSFSTAYSALANFTGFSFPFVLVPHIELVVAVGPFFLSDATQIAYSPMLTERNRAEWEQHAVQQRQWTGDTIEGRDLQDGIFRFDENLTAVDEPKGNEPYFPVWQNSPSNQFGQPIMFNLRSEPREREAIDEMIQTRRAVISKVHLHKSLDEAFEKGHVQSHSHRRRGQESDHQEDDDVLHKDHSESNSTSAFSVMYVPVRESLDNGGNITGMVSIHFDWSSYFEGVVRDEVDLVVVLEDRDGSKVSFGVQGSHSHFLGEGDLHDSRYTSLATEVNSIDKFRDDLFDTAPIDPKPYANTFFSEYNQEPYEGTDDIFEAYRIHVYPTRAFENSFRTFRPLLFTGAAIFIFLFCVALFLAYDYLVERRQDFVMNHAQKSTAIVRSLFPPVVRKRLLGNNEVDLDSDNNEHHRRFTPSVRMQASLSAPSTNGAGELVSNPIADMFPSVTIMFADIAGFTAWSSEREPTQVFLLLESLYGAYDQLARSMGVFKVETIGDCYVAVVGLPEPQNDHAVIMCRFAHECLLKMKTLTKQLDIKLGPGTSELGLRIGLHSGPVTAGVLRGDKSRFQLFGDSMNTASRMESTGVRGKIHVSKSTADLLTEANKSHWLAPRVDMVDAKGLGKVRTYWMKPCPRPKKKAVAINKSALVDDGSAAPDVALVDSSGWEVPLRPSFGRTFSIEKFEFTTPSLGDSSPAEHSDNGDDMSWWGETEVNKKGQDSRSPGKMIRSIDWNTDLLLKLLEKVVKHRHLESSRKMYRKVYKDTSSSNGIMRRSDRLRSQQHFDDVSSKASSKASDERNGTTHSLLTPAVRSQMRDFVATVASLYEDHAFHNFEHACHVTQAASRLVNSLVAPSRKRADSDSSSAALSHNSSQPLFRDPLDHFLVVFVALFHDVDHKGLPNWKLIEEYPEMAKRYGTESIAEKHALAIVTELLHEERFKELKVCICGTPSNQANVFRLLEKGIIATDIGRSELQLAREEYWYQAFDNSSLPSQCAHADTFHATIVMEYIIQASDVAHTMQHWHIFCKWNERLFQENYAAYIAGRALIDPSTDWYEDQIRFFDGFVIPLAQKLKRCGLFGVQSEEYLRYARENRAEWKLKGEQVTQDFRSRAIAWDDAFQVPNL